MRTAVGLLACLAAGAMTTARADPPTEAAPAAAPAAQSAPASAAPAAPAATATQAAPPAPPAKPEVDTDTRHFLAEGYKPEMHRGEQVYCRKETALGSRLAPVKSCGTIEQLKLNEQATKDNLRDVQRMQGIPTR